MEARSGFEPLNKGFADLFLKSTSRCRSTTYGANIRQLSKVFQTGLWPFDSDPTTPSGPILPLVTDLKARAKTPWGASGRQSPDNSVVGIERIVGDPKDLLSLRIRGTEIRFWDVYRALTCRRPIANTDLLQRLDEADIAAVWEYADHLIGSRTHDELTGRPILEKDRLVHGRYYKGRCRNATVARWNGDEQCFYHWREKFGRIYIETIKYPTDETELFWDVFEVLEELATSKFEIPFDMEAAFAGTPDDLFEYEAEMWKMPMRR